MDEAVVPRAGAAAIGLTFSSSPRQTSSSDPDTDESDEETLALDFSLINRQFHLSNSIRRVTGGWVIPAPECAFVDILSSLDLDNSLSFENEVANVVRSQISDTDGVLEELWATCNSQEGLNMVSNLWHEKSRFVGVCLAKFKLQHGKDCKVAVVSTYLIEDISVVQKQGFGSSVTPFKLPGNEQTRLSYHRFRVVQFVEDLMTVTIKRFCELSMDRSIPFLKGNEAEWTEINGELEDFNKENRKLNLILCLDGGGTRGYLAAGLLKLLFDTYPDVDITTVFDQMYGTSAGAIVAASLWSGAISLKEMQDRFVRISERIFPASRHFGSFRNLTNKIVGTDKYKSKPVDLEIFRNFPILTLSPISTRMSKIVPELVIHTTDATSTPLVPKLFRSSSNKFSTIAMSVRASIAAPMYIPSMIVEREKNDGDNRFIQLIDGGILNNDPTGSALSDYFSMGGYPDKQTVIISIGTGAIENSSVMNDVHNFSSISKVSEFVASTSNFQALIQPRDDNRSKYIRLQPKLRGGNLDDIERATFESWSNAVVGFPSENPEVWNAAQDVIKQLIDSGICEERLKLKRRVVAHMFAKLATCDERQPISYHHCPLTLSNMGDVGFGGRRLEHLRVQYHKLQDGVLIARFVQKSNGNVVCFRDSWVECKPRAYCLTDGYRMNRTQPQSFSLVSVRYPRKFLGLVNNALDLVDRDNAVQFRCESDL